MKYSFCPYCGKPVSGDDHVCMHCGARLADDDACEGTHTLDEATSTLDESTRTFDKRPLTPNDATRMASYDAGDTVMVPDEDTDLSAFGSDNNDVDHEARRPRKSAWIVVVIVLAVLLFGSSAFYYFVLRNNESVDVNRESLSSDNEVEVPDDNIDVIEPSEPQIDFFRTPDLVFNELHGRVKSVTNEDGSFTFDAMGNINDNNGYSYERNGSGYIIVSNAEYDDGAVVTTNYHFDGTRYTGFEQSCPEHDFFANVTFTYNADGTLASASVIYPNDESIKSMIEYSDYRFDRVNNWISRKVTTNYTIQSEDGATDHDRHEYVETRKISYYEDN